MLIHWDNQGAIVLSKDNKFHVRMKYIDKHNHFIHEDVTDGKILVDYVPSHKNVSYIFIKALPKNKFQHF